MHTQPPPQIWLHVFEASTDILRLCIFGSGRCKKSCKKAFQGLLPFAVFIGAAFVVRILSSVFIWALPHVPGHELWGSRWPRSWTCIPGLTSDRPLYRGHLWWSELFLTLLTITGHESSLSLNLILHWCYTPSVKPATPINLAATLSSWLTFPYGEKGAATHHCCSLHRINTACILVFKKKSS